MEKDLTKTQADPKDGDTGTDPPGGGTKAPTALGLNQDLARNEADPKDGDAGTDPPVEPKNDKVLGVRKQPKG